MRDVLDSDDFARRDDADDHMLAAEQGYDAVMHPTAYDTADDVSDVQALSEGD